MIPSLTPLTNRLRRRVAAAVAVAVTAFLPLAVPTAPTAQASDGAFRTAAATGGYWMVGSDGGIFSFGQAPFYGSTGSLRLNQPIVGMTASPTGQGYWFVASDGGIFAFGDAKFYGSMGGKPLNRPIVGMASTPTGKGYWLVASDGGIFAFGDATFFGSTGNIRLNKPIVGMAATKSGQGYWFVASDGGIFAYGDAKFYGSMGGKPLAKPISFMAATPSGAGYWFTSTDGTIYNFGDAGHFGAAPDRPLTRGPRTMAAMIPSPDGMGYWQASTAGEVLAFGSAVDLGGLSGKLNKPIVGMTAVPSAPAGPTTNPSTPGGPNPTVTTGPTTGTTLPPYSGPMKFSSSALHSWGTPADTAKGRESASITDEATCLDRRGAWNAGAQKCTVYPYSQKIVTIVELGSKVFVGGYFSDMHRNDNNRTPTPSGIPGGRSFIAELDADGNMNPNSPFNTSVKIDGPVRALYTDGTRLYVGGEFNKVNGEPRAHLVALNPATGAVDSSFNPPVPDKYVNAITGSGSRVYVAGAYTTPSNGLTAFQSNGQVDPGFNAPQRYNGKFVGHTGTRVDDPLAKDPATPDPTGSIEALKLTADGRSLMVGGSFLHFGFDHAADPNHLHSGFITVDATSGGLCGAAGVQCTWQPEQASNSSRPIFDIEIYRGDPHTIGINATQLAFTASGGAGGRVIAWTPNGSKKQLWRGNMDGDVMSVAVTQDRVYVVGHYDHTVADPNDPCLQIDPATGGVHCDDGTSNRHLAAFFASGEIVGGKNTGKSLIDSEFRAQADTSEGPYVVTIGANRMYVGGNFTDVANFPTGTSCPYPDTSLCAEFRQPGFMVFPPFS